MISRSETYGLSDELNAVRIVEFAPGDWSLAARLSPIGGLLALDQLAMPAEQRLGAGQQRSPGRPGQGTAPRLGPAAEDQNLQPEAHNGVEGRVERDRAAWQGPRSARALASLLAPKRSDAAGVNLTGHLP